MRESRDSLMVEYLRPHQRIADPKPDSIKDLQTVCIWCTLNMTSGGKRPPAGEAWKFEESMPSQVSFSSSKHDSNLRGTSRNSLRVVSERLKVAREKLFRCGKMFETVFQAHLVLPNSRVPLQLKIVVAKDCAL
ncbi:hypothetical protein AVEN_109180-1 [Araneus ventricosus]|uniref:Uncharacterized protein n=1 Tax=Araneus ventricosus TaxID=182803 RepID=A0A4Y2L6T0_ARAVE|nr:hypothetical protein AVEN_109180-1 [Araneus ventricosus]